MQAILHRVPGLYSYQLPVRIVQAISKIWSPNAQAMGKYMQLRLYL